MRLHLLKDIMSDKDYQASLIAFIKSRNLFTIKTQVREVTFLSGRTRDKGFKVLSDSDIKKVIDYYDKNTNTINPSADLLRRAIKKLRDYKERVVI